MAEDSHGMGIPIPADSTKISDFPGVTRNAMERVAEILAGDVLPAGMAKVAKGAVEEQMQLQDLVVGSDPRMPQMGASDEHLFVVLDSERRESWLGANKSDGGPTPWALEHLRRGLGVGPADGPGYLMALTDSVGNLTDLAIRSTDGQFADFVIERLKKRILAGFTAPGSPAAEVQLDGAFGSTAPDVVLPLPNMRSVSGWGSSSLNLWAPKFAELFTRHGAAYFNGATPGEMIQHICARLGSHPAQLAFPADTIPATGAVTVTSPNMPAGATMRTFTGSVAGVRGTLSSTASALTFTRTSSGSAVTVPAGAEFIPDIGPQHRADVVVFEMGKNNLTGTAGRADLVNRMFDEAVAWLSPRIKRLLVPGSFVNRNATAAAKAQVLEVNAHRAARYGQLYVDVQGYVTGEQVWRDTGLTPTAADLAQQARGEKPDSLSLDDAHLNTAGQNAVFALFESRLDTLRWY